MMVNIFLVIIYLYILNLYIIEKNSDLNNLIDIKKQDLLQKRYNKFRKMGNFYEV